MKITSRVKMPPIEFSEAQMRGIQDKQTSLWAVITIEDRIPSSHPLRGVKELADQRLVALSRVFNRMYSPVGRPSIAPERILKSLPWSTKRGKPTCSATIILAWME